MGACWKGKYSCLRLMRYGRRQVAAFNEKLCVF